MHRFISTSLCGGLRTTAQRSGDHWILNGEKQWVSHATGWDGTGPDLMTVVCRAGDEPDPRRSLALLLVPGPIQGLVVTEILVPLGHRAELLPRFSLVDVRVPTANLATPNDLVPPSGVYATLASVDGIVLPAVTNVGMRPTFGDVTAPVIETHVLDTDRDLYDRPLRLLFVQRLRDERQFPDVDALRAQIDADIRGARRLFRRISL